MEHPASHPQFVLKQSIKQTTPIRSCHEAFPIHLQFVAKQFITQAPPTCFLSHYSFLAVNVEAKPQ